MDGPPVACCKKLQEAESETGDHMWRKRVLVVGGSGDIGRAIAKSLYETGAHVISVARRPDRLVWKELPEPYSAPVLLAADLTSPADIERLGTELSRFRPLNAVVMSSGAYHRSTDIGIFRMQIEANVIGPYALLRKLLPILIEDEGDIVFINSSQALRASPAVMQYAATKHALKAIADGLRDEVNVVGVRVTSIYLGRTAGERQREISTIEGRQYVPEHLIQPDDVASTVRYILQLPRTAEVTDISIRPRQKT